MPNELLPSYRSPPLVEVVVGAYFPSIDPFMIPHFGLFWGGLHDALPVVSEVETLAVQVPPSIKRFSPNTLVVPKKPLPRVWFASTDGSQLLQLQRNALLFNWRKTEATPDYPRFDWVCGRFWSYLQHLKEFVSEQFGETVSPFLLELSYVNTIPSAIWERRGWGPRGVIDGHPRQAAPVAGLFDERAFSLQMVRPLPNAEGDLIMNFATAQLVASQRDVLQLEISAKGFPSTNSESSQLSWLQGAHRLVVQAFADVTDKDVQREDWGRES
jgi:uncharacterized protein (TIGR04255 family)